MLRWYRSTKLTLSEAQTKAMFLKREREREYTRRAPRRNKGPCVYGAKRQKKSKYDSKPLQIMIEKTEIAFKKSVRYLEVHSDQDLKPTAHIKTRCAKLNKTFGRLRHLARIGLGLRFLTMPTINRSNFLPVVTYAAAGKSDLCRKEDWKALRVIQW